MKDPRIYATRAREPISPDDAEWIEDGILTPSCIECRDMGGQCDRHAEQ